MQIPHVMLVRSLLATFSRQIDVGVYSMPMDMQVWGGGGAGGGVVVVMVVVVWWWWWWWCWW